MSPLEQYHKNFIKGVKLLMAENENLPGIKEVADFLEISYMALYKIMDGTNRPTAELGITLCKKAGYSGNWMFLNKGVAKFEDQATLNKILKKILVKSQTKSQTKTFKK